MTDRLHAVVVSRDADEASRLVFTFTREPTDHEMREMHDVLNMLLSNQCRLVVNEDFIVSPMGMH